jgi:hypothetical protein
MTSATVHTPTARVVPVLITRTLDLMPLASGDRARARVGWAPIRTAGRQPALDERGLEHVDRLLAVGTRRAELATACRWLLL